MGLTKEEMSAAVSALRIIQSAKIQRCTPEVEAATYGLSATLEIGRPVLDKFSIVDSRSSQSIAGAEQEAKKLMERGYDYTYIWQGGGMNPYVATGFKSK